MNILKGLAVGVIAGFLDVIPMVLQKLSWTANISAFTMWIAIGILLSLVHLKINPFLKGIIISFLVLAPNAVLIGWQEPISLIPIFAMTLVLGSLSGFAIAKLNKE